MRGRRRLFSAIITERLRDLTRLARRLRADHPAGEAFITFLTATVEQSRHNRSLASVFDQADGGEEMETAGREMNAELTALLEQAQADGTIRDDIDFADVHAIASAVLAMDTHPANHPADRAKRIAIVLDGLRPPGRRG